MEDRGEEKEAAAERLAWEAQVDEAVAVVSVAGEEAAALLARRRRKRRTGAEEEEEQGGGGDGDGESGEEGESDAGDFFFAPVDVGDDARVSELREAGFEAAGPLQLRLLVEIEIPEERSAGEEEEEEGGGAGGNSPSSITLTVGGGDGGVAAASVSSLQPLRLALAIPRLYLMPLSPASEGEEEEEGEKIPAVSVSAPWLSVAAASSLEARLRSFAREQQQQQQQQLGEQPLPVVFDLIELAKESALAEALSSSASGGGGRGGRSLDLLEVVVGGGGGASGGGGEEAGEEEEGDTADADDDNANSAEAAALALLRQLLSDDAAQRRQRFARGSHACCVCLEEGVPGSHATALPCCGDWRLKVEKNSKSSSSSSSTRAACNACLVALAKAALAAKDASALACPFPDCREPLPPALLSSLLSKEDAELAESLRLERALAKMGALRCPHCDFAAALADAQGCCLCPKCSFAFCATCFDAWHGGSRECSSAEARLALARARARNNNNARRGGGTSESGSGSDRASAAALRRAEEEYLSLAAIARGGFKPCPACRTPIERTAGCNRMRCAACSTSFCFVCSAIVEEGYSHFGSGSKCRLLSAEEIARWEREEGGGAGQERAAAADRNAFWLQVARREANNNGDDGLPRHRAIRVSRCPNCGGQHAGESNDRRCGNCKTRHCGSCGEVLRRGVVHFGRPPKCPAHF